MLTPEQIGILAAQIKVALELYPNKPPEDVALDANEPDPMEPWGRCLKALIDQDPILLSYDKVQNDSCFNFLVHYYGS